jgi:DNA-binding transcriptional LysR family regulator
VHPTQAGRALHAACQEIFRALTDAEDRLDDIRGNAMGSLHVASGTVGAWLAPRLLTEFARARPGIDVTLQVKSRKELFGRLSANLDDLYICANPPQDADVVVQRIVPNPIVAFARSDHPLAAAGAVPFERFAREPLLAREPGSGTRMTTERIYAARGATPHIRMELGSNEAVKEALLSGLGVSVLSRHAIGLAPDAPRLSVLDVEGFPLEAHLHFVYPVGKQLSGVARAFMEFSRTEAKRIAAGAPAGA